MRSDDQTLCQVYSSSFNEQIMYIKSCKKYCVVGEKKWRCFFVCAELTFHTTLSRERSEEVSVELTLYFVSNKRINCFHSSAPGLVDRPNVEFRFRQCLLRML